jgi:eukaryotic-like serine/threonine-protein kinase
MNNAQDLIGRTLEGKYVITDVLGEGAMGIVYRGFDEETLNEVAIKVLQPSLAGFPEVVARFHREAAAARRVDHEGTVRVLGRGCEDGLDYLVMELLQGEGLAAVLGAANRLPEARAARLVVQLCGALAVAHERGVVHRDIKPENIMVVAGGDGLGERVKLLDFGIAKRLPVRERRAEDSFSNGEDTRAGSLVGTPEYMAPEQCMGCDVDARTDIYACGVLLYRMVTGRVPFGGEDTHLLEICQRHLGEDPTPPRALAPWLRPALEAVILKALRKLPSERHQSAIELRQELAQVLAGIEQIEAEPTKPFAHADLALTAPEDLLEDVMVPVPLACPVTFSAPRASLVDVPSIADRPTLVPSQGAPDFGLVLRSLWPTVAVATAIGVGLGSLFMVLR